MGFLEVKVGLLDTAEDIIHARFSFKNKYIIICSQALQKLFTGSENNPNSQIFLVGEGIEVLQQRS